MTSDTHLRRQPTNDDRAAIVGTIFGHLPIGHNGPQLEEEYFSYYSQQLNSLRFQYGRGGIWEFPLNSHKEVLEIVSTLRDNGRALTKCQLRQQLQSRPSFQSCAAADIDAVMDTGARLWLMTNFRSAGDPLYDSGRDCVEWLDNLTLEAQLDHLFKVSRSTESEPQRRRMSPRFTAANMADICNLEVAWTSCLADHLRLDRQRKVLWVFTHRHFLLACCKIRKSEADRTGAEKKSLPTIPLPVEILEETNRTLDLLFPSTDGRTRNLLKMRGRAFHLIAPQQRSRDLRDYPFWRDRILELYEDIFLGEPEGWTQLWRDRRDMQKFWTFWIALAIFILTVVSTVATIIQTWASLKALERA